MQKLRDQQEGVTIYFGEKNPASQKDATEQRLLYFYTMLFQMHLNADIMTRGGLMNPFVTTNIKTQCVVLANIIINKCIHQDGDRDTW